LENASARKTFPVNSLLLHIAAAPLASGNQVVLRAGEGRVGRRSA
jgi:hypothetical protein